MRTGRWATMSATVVTTLAAFPGTAARADRAYVYDQLDLAGDLTVVRTSDDGTRLTFLATHTAICGRRHQFDDTLRIVGTPPVSLNPGVLVTGPAARAPWRARVIRVRHTVAGTQSIKGQFVLKRVTTRRIDARWDLVYTSTPKRGRVQRCATHESIRLQGDGDYYVGSSRQREPVAVHDEGDAAAPELAYRARCESRRVVSAIFLAPIALSPTRDFGWTQKQDYDIAVLNFNPASVVMNGHLETAQASGNFRLDVTWDGTDPCTTGPLTWTAVRG
jgi:hypothetical protein